MAKKITIMTGSVREGRAADKILTQVKAIAANNDLDVTIADLKELNLPFVDTPVPPSAEGYEPNHESVKKWGKIVEGSEAIIMLTPEYNHAITAVQKHAIDWLFAEWNEKPVAIISYGWGGGADSAAQLAELLERVKARRIEPTAQLYFTKDIDLDGTALDYSAFEEKISPVIEAAKSA